ncbi:MAG: Gfo/Idh/MocA family oxidoreductase [Ignavibacteriae bacterium]|nr:Gfo/Idh/MocA family oxidoreductase [Ignavibacteriota bacterium]
MKKIKIALIGCGYISEYHTRGLQQLENVEIVGVVGLPIESAKNFAKKYGIKNYSDNYQDFLNDKTIDAAIISTPNKFHSPFAIEFLNHGKDVFIEKPMAINPIEGEKIKNAAIENNNLVMVGHMWRFDIEVNFIKDLVQSGKLGKIIKTKGYGIHENWGPEGWFTNKDLAGGGALADMGVHAIDTVRFILGDPKSREVYAKIGTYFGNYNVDDSGIIIITWENGISSIIESGWWHPHMDGPEASTQIFGTEGYASLFPTIVKMKSGEIIEVPKTEKSEHCDQTIYSEQMKNFVESIIFNKRPNPGILEGQEVIKIVDAAYNSANSGKVIHL